MNDLKSLHFYNPEDLRDYCNTNNIKIESIAGHRSFLILFYREITN